MKYDAIISGGGMAGLSLAYYLNNSTLRDKHILIIDRQAKHQNDRTWGFWEVGTGTFDEVLHRYWHSVWFHGLGGFSKKMGLSNYRYKLLRGIDFYEFVQKNVVNNANISFVFGDILSVSSSEKSAKVQTSVGDFEADWCFDSTHRLKVMQGFSADFQEIHPSKKTDALLQHFKGWVIKTPQATFDVETPVMMDFRIDQANECRFFYVLPTSEHEALVEFTLFTPELLPANMYDEALKKYLFDFLKITDYQILEEEFGIIPMSTEAIQEKPYPRIVRIGTAGGNTRPSTGYTFTRTQKRLQKIVHTWETTGSPITKNPPISGWVMFLDKVFLNVFLKKRVLPAKIFTALYEKNPAERIFRFLDEDSSWYDDLRVIVSVPIWPFTKAALALLFRPSKAKKN